MELTLFWQYRGVRRINNREARFKSDVIEGDGEAASGKAVREGLCEEERWHWIRILGGRQAHLGKAVQAEGRASAKILLSAVVQSLTHVRLFATPRMAACQTPLSFTISRPCSNSCPLS